MAYTTINKSTSYFNTKLYSGNGSSNAQTGVGFQPDLFWCKSRSNAENHTLIDAVRGVGYGIGSNTSAVQYSGTNFGSFDSDGFTWSGNLGSGNENGQNYVAWNWKANGAGSANSDGSQSSTVSVNTTAGFSIVKFVNNTSSTTNTFGHGLGAVPKVIMMRSLDDAYNWDVHHHKIAISKRLVLNSNAAQANSTYMNSTSPTNQVFTVKSDEFGSNSNCIAYCFAEKTGYSKFGSYAGNASAEGPFIYTGFAPSFIIIKSIAQNHWMMRDNKRPGYNPNFNKLFPDRDVAENTDTSNQMDFLSNGFKLKASNTEQNGSSTTYIYMAFGQSLVGTNNIPVTAR